MSTILQVIHMWWYISILWFFYKLTNMSGHTGKYQFIKSCRILRKRCVVLHGMEGRHLASPLGMDI